MLDVCCMSGLVSRSLHLESGEETEGGVARGGGLPRSRRGKVVG